MKKVISFCYRIIFLFPLLKLNWDYQAIKRDIVRKISGLKNIDMKMDYEETYVFVIKHLERIIPNYSNKVSIISMCCFPKNPDLIMMYHCDEQRIYINKKTLVNYIYNYCITYDKRFCEIEIEGFLIHELDHHEKKNIQKHWSLYYYKLVSPEENPRIYEYHPFELSAKIAQYKFFTNSLKKTMN